MELVSRMRGHGTTVFTRISALAARHAAVNLGQGFPDSDGPPAMLEAARAAITGGHNQYPPLAGLPQLRQAIARHQERFYGLTPDPESEVLVSVGATEAIAAALLALCEPGDEVVVFEPTYDSYGAIADLAGAVLRPVMLGFPDFALDPVALRAAFSERTRLVLLNTPHNPTGKVFSPVELALIAALATEFDAWVLTDEVYEHLTFGADHTPMATLPGMAERTLTVSSAGKTFSATGWKIGWVSGPAAAISAIAVVKQYLTFAASGPFQLGVTTALDLPVPEYHRLRDDLWARRDLLSEGLARVGFDVAIPQGSYFVLADAAPFGVSDAAALAQALPARVGVAAIPVSAFVSDPAATPTLLRFAFCKAESVLRDGLERLERGRHQIREE